MKNEKKKKKNFGKKCRDGNVLETITQYTMVIHEKDIENMMRVRTVMHIYIYIYMYVYVHVYVYACMYTQYHTFRQPYERDEHKCQHSIGEKLPNEKQQSQKHRDEHDRFDEMTNNQRRIWDLISIVYA